MTLLVGPDGGGWTPTDGPVQSNGGDAVWVEDGYVAVATGTITSCNLYVTNWNTANTARVYCYDSSRAIVGTSDAFSSGDGTGLLNKPMSGSVTSAGLYRLAIRTDTGYLGVRRNSGGSTFAVNGYAMSAGYPTGDATLAAGTNDSPQEFIIWLDGSAGGGVTLMGAMCL